MVHYSWNTFLSVLCARLATKVDYYSRHERLKKKKIQKTVIHDTPGCVQGKENPKLLSRGGGNNHFKTVFLSGGLYFNLIQRTIKNWANSYVQYVRVTCATCTDTAWRGDTQCTPKHTHPHYQALTNRSTKAIEYFEYVTPRIQNPKSKQNRT